MTPILSAIAPLSATTKAWFVDIWGVMHNGAAPFAEAVVACQTFRTRGGIVILVSNAPRPNASVQTQLDRIGVARDAYDAIISSGDISRALISGLAGKPVYHLGPERDLALYDGLNVSLAPPSQAQAIVCTGLFDDERETAQNYAPILTPLASSRTPMICANPDLSVERGGRIIACAGAVAAFYAHLGGVVTYAGKPFSPIYDAAFACVDALAGHGVERSQILAIGDGVRTDIAGAAHVGIRSVYIASAIHLGADALDRDSLSRLFPDSQGRPIAAMTRLTW